MTEVLYNAFKSMTDPLKLSFIHDYFKGNVLDHTEEDINTFEEDDEFERFVILRENDYMLIKNVSNTLLGIFTKKKSFFDKLIQHFVFNQGNMIIKYDRLGTDDALINMLKSNIKGIYNNYKYKGIYYVYNQPNAVSLS